MLKYLHVLTLLSPSIALHAQSLLWEISGRALKKNSYLYGTMHTTDARVFNFSSQVMQAFEACDVFVMELNPQEILTSQLIEKLVMDSGITLQRLLGDDDYMYVAAFFRDSLKQNLFLYNRMQPMFVSGIVSSRKLGKEQSEALDIYLYRLANEQNKKVVGLETMEEQVTAFRSIPYSEQAKGLLKTVKESAKVDSTMEALLQHYIQGNLEGILEMTENEKQYENFLEIFIVRRNELMAERSENIIQEQSAFIAVGAAHLAGNQGIITLLRSKGYTVTPVR